MGLLQAAYRTYDTLDKIYTAGAPLEGMKTLTPVSHMIQNAEIEITITLDGKFISAINVDKKDNETVIPVTEESANRTSKFSPHPLAEQFEVLSGKDSEKTDKYIELLSSWVNSEYTHEKANAVLKYVMSFGIAGDLENAGVGKVNDKSLVRWQVVPSEIPACHKDTKLMRCYTEFYKSIKESQTTDICMISGEVSDLTVNHPKGTVKSSFGAKLISSNDSSGFTYRGRFIEDSEALSIGYEASQKAHNALRFLLANQGTNIKNRIFLCWNPEGKIIPKINYDDYYNDFDFMNSSEDDIRFDDYREKLKETLWGRDNQMKLDKDDDVIIASFEAATTGRLSVTYYNEMSGKDFLTRLENWYTTLCVYSGRKVRTPSLTRIVKCAFGTQRGNSLEVDDRIWREQVGHLFHCIVDGKPISINIVKAIADKSSRLIIYSTKLDSQKKISNRLTVLTTACAVIRKYRNDLLKREEWKLSLDEKNTNRSYLFGRLLAIAEKAERDTYQKDEEREPNAMRMQSIFSQRPMYAWRILEEQLKPYYARMTPGLRQYYKKLTQSITEGISASDENLNRSLDDVYLLGYYHQREALYTKKDSGETNKTVGESLGDPE